MAYRDNRHGSFTELLVRSETEVARVLSDVVRDGNPLTSFLEESDHIFVSRLRFVDPARRFILAAPGENKAANALILRRDSVMLGGAAGNAFIEFVGRLPQDVFLSGTMNIRFEFPESLILRQRRTYHRIQVLPTIPLDCIVGSAGPFSFKAKIIDISPGGFGALISDDRIDLTPGRIFRGCLIPTPRRTITGLDMEIRHAEKIRLAGGGEATRAGFTFHGSQSDMESLLTLFIVDLEQPESNSE